MVMGHQQQQNQQQTVSGKSSGKAFPKRRPKEKTPFRTKAPKGRFHKGDSGKGAYPKATPSPDSWENAAVWSPSPEKPREIEENGPETKGFPHKAGTLAAILLTALLVWASVQAGKRDRAERPYEGYVCPGCGKELSFPPYRAKGKWWWEKGLRENRKGMERQREKTVREHLEKELWKRTGKGDSVQDGSLRPSSFR